MNKIIIGRTPSCLLYSWRTQTPCLLDKKLEFHPFDEEYEGLDFSEFNATNSDEMVVNLSFALGITGLLLQPNNVENIRIDEKIKVFTKGSRMVEYDAEPVYFDEKQTGLFNVFDSFFWRRGETHDLFEIKGEEPIKKVVFYPSRRSRVKPCTKDVMVLSKMDENQLLDSDYGNGIVRISALRMMSERGLKGNFAHEVNGKRYYKAIKLEFDERKVTPIYEQMYSFKEVYEMEQRKERQWKMFETLRLKQKT